jgi:hypothetical protein
MTPLSLAATPGAAHRVGCGGTPLQVASADLPDWRS